MVTVDKVVHIPLTKEQFEAAYVLWMSGAQLGDMADGLGLNDCSANGLYTVDWAMVMRAAGALGKYTVNYKDSNQPTM